MTKVADNSELSMPRIEILSEDECLLLLGHAPVGRLGFASQALPVVLPINFTIDRGAIVFGTEPGLKLDATRLGAVACLEVDDHDTISHTGWSVLATGRLAEISDPERLEQARRLPLSPWAARGEVHYVELPIELLSGRRIRRW